MKPPRSNSPPRYTTYKESDPPKRSPGKPEKAPEMDLANMSYEDYVRAHPQGEKRRLEPRERSSSPKRSSPRRSSPRRSSPRRASSPPRRSSRSPPRSKTRITDYRARSPTRKRSKSRSPSPSRSRSRSKSPRSSSRRNHPKKNERTEPYPSGRLDRRKDERDRSPRRDRDDRDSRDDRDRDRYRGKPDYGYSSRDYGSSYYPQMDPYAMQYFLMWKHAQTSGYSSRRDYR